MQVSWRRFHSAICTTLAFKVLKPRLGLWGVPPAAFWRIAPSNSPETSYLSHWREFIWSMLSLPANECHWHSPSVFRHWIGLKSNKCQVCITDKLDVTKVQVLFCCHVTENYFPSPSGLLLIQRKLPISTKINRHGSIMIESGYK